MYKRAGESCFVPFLGNGVALLRARQRFRHRIHGSLAQDTLLSTFCPLCVMCQLKQDMDFVESQGQEI
ncbi:hypothetical protein FBUS_04388 [Fasciolopsis buskii]|uniref:Uncharacterized protein n=1 Tax=Fasciolopsis buskii TaxID=27845 RepID=A0A8E0RZ69_9TREM|nr:hypothetical protein FBUS_04388 [Fasciolopsis buski]